MRNLFLLIFLSCANFCWAQQTDIVTLKDGTELRGEVLKYLNDGKVLKLKLQNGKKVFVHETEVEKVEQSAQNTTILYKSRSLFEVDKKGIYGTAKVGMLAGTATWGRGGQVGLSVSSSIGYRFNEYIAVGIGVGADEYNVWYNDVVFPVFTEVWGFIADQSKLDWYYKLSGGYGYVPRNQNNGRANGGIMLHPSIGFRFGKSPNIGYTVDLGIRFQNAEYLTNSWGGRTDENVRYQRYALRFGILF